MTDEAPQFDPDKPSTTIEGVGDAPAFDPSQPSKDIEGRERDLSERFMQGVTESGRGAAEWAEKYLPEVKQAESSSATPSLKKDKVQPKDFSEDFDPVQFAGSMANPVPGGSIFALGKVAPKMPALVKGMIGGGITGLLEPVGAKHKDEFGPQKFVQTGQGMLMGFGLTLGGKGLSKGAEAIGDFIVRRHPDMIANKAVEAVLGRINREAKGELTAEQAIKLADELGAKGKPVALGDVAGPDTQRLAGHIHRQGGEAGSFAETTLKKRDQGLDPMKQGGSSQFPLSPGEKSAAQRMDEDVAKHISSGSTAFEAVEMLNATQRANSAPLYAATDKLQLWSPKLERLLDGPEMQKALNKGFEHEAILARARDEPFNLAMFGLHEANGEIKLGARPSMRVLDMVKRGLDNLIESHIDPIGGISAEGRALSTLKNAYVAELDSLDKSGVYRKARQAWGGPEANKSAIALGKQVFTTHPEVGGQEVAKMGPGEFEFYKIGVADIMRERIGRSGLTADESKAILKSDWMRRQLSHTFKTEAEFNAFLEAVQTERKMFQFKKNTLGNSKTAERVAEDAKNAESTIKEKFFEMAYSSLRGHPLRAVSSFYRFHRAVGVKPDPKLNEAIAKILFSPEAAERQVLRNPPAKPQNIMHKVAQKTDDFSPYLTQLEGVNSNQVPPE